MVKAIKICVNGDVQGVGFRARVRSIANAYSVYGYVRNMPDGSVEIHVEGDDHSVEAFIETIKSLKEYEVWGIEIAETAIKGYSEFLIIP